MLYYPSLPDILRTIFSVPNMALTNAMAGRVFRNTILFVGPSREREFSIRLPEI